MRNETNEEWYNRTFPINPSSGYREYDSSSIPPNITLGDN